jgi:hypothetical protein
MNHIHPLRRQAFLILTILGLAVLGSPLAQTGATHVLPGTTPLLIAPASVPAPGTALLTGQHFTPGGEVYIALYDQWGIELHETRWVTASVTVYGANGSQDPASGYLQGGTLRELFGTIGSVFGPNGSQDPATGYVEVGTNGSAFGSNGSQDPAIGYVAGQTGNLCGATIMARAYDLQAATWSNVSDIDLGC